MSKLTDAIERVFFGGTIQERVDLQKAIIDQRVEAALMRMVNALDSDEEYEAELEAERVAYEQHYQATAD